jgi:hypothetical protein
MTSFSWLKGRLPTCFMLVVCLAFIPGSVLAADVDVYAEGAYTDTDLVIYLYADINVGPILSFGVRVNYPTGLTYSDFTKNDGVWYFGDGGADYPYMDPEDDGTGVVFIGGKLDTNTPTAGVNGTRVLLGTLTFTHSGVTDFSGVTMDLGRGGDYANFVDTVGNVKDGAGVSFAMTIRERGDANIDGFLTSADMFAIRSKLGGPYEVWADCNGDNFLTSADMFCVRNKL